jgi:hypothetical protein
MSSDSSDAAAFISPDKRHRFERLYERRTRSSKDLNKWSAFMSSSEMLDPTILVPLEPSVQPSDLHRQLVRLGAPDSCEVVTDSAKGEGRSPLMAAINAVFGQGFGAIIVCVPGRLGYYEGEPFGDRYILHRPLD